MFFCELGDITVVGSSPEALVKLQSGHAQLRPIAGFAAARGDAEHDAKLEAELLADPKENAEHVMLVDLARKRSRARRHGRHGARGPLSRDRALQPHHHIVSGVHASSPRPGCLRSVRRGVPGGTLVGAPKVRADADHRRDRACRQGLTGARWAYFAGRATWISDYDSHARVRAATAIAIRPAAVSSRIACRGGIRRGHGEERRMRRALAIAAEGV